MKYSQGQVIKNKDGKRKILEVLTQTYFLSSWASFDEAGSLYTEKELDEMGYSLVEEGLVEEELVEEEKEWPQIGDTYEYITEFGFIELDKWDNASSDRGRITYSNVFRPGTGEAKKVRDEIQAKYGKK